MKITELNILFHVDLDPAKHKTREDLQRSTAAAWDILQFHQPLKPGDRIVVMVVRDPAGTAG